MDHSNISRFHNPPFFIESRSGKENIVDLPLTRLLTGIDEGNMLLVNRACLTICVSFIFVIVQHLNFITFLQEYSTVAPALTCLIRVHLSRSSPFYVQLKVSKLLLRLN